MKVREKFSNRHPGAGGVIKAHQAEQGDRDRVPDNADFDGDREGVADRTGGLRAGSEPKG